MPRAKRRDGVISFALGFSRRSMNLCTQAGEWKSSSLFTVCLIALFTAALTLFIASLFIAVSALFCATFSALSTTFLYASGVWACCFFCLYHLSKPDSVLLLCDWRIGILICDQILLRSFKFPSCTAAGDAAGGAARDATCRSVDDAAGDEEGDAAGELQRGHERRQMPGGGRRK